MKDIDLGRERCEGSEDTELKVTDRRLFTADGNLREALDDPEDTDAEDTEPPEGQRSAQEQAPQPVASANEEVGFEREPIEEPEGVDFTMLLNAMAQPALIFLGEIAHPETGRPEINLEQARLQIDLLDLLRIKCRGNLSHEEDGLLDRLLYQLRMLCVARSNEPPQAG